jgi:phosphoserine phosphatase
MYLICDFDGTLVKNDFFEEKVFKLFLKQPWQVLKYFFREEGLLNLKHQLLDDYLPEYDLEFIFNQILIEWIKENRKNYQETLLISASPDLFVKRVAVPLNIFDRIHGSLSVNLKGQNKLRFIQESGLLPFSYIGNSSTDTPIFKASNQAYLINSNGIKKLK